MVATSHSKTPSEEMLSSVIFESLDVADKIAVSKIAEKHNIDTIYHLAGLLSAVGERNPMLAWQVNIGGLLNVLEIARERNMIRVFWPSSIAVFGPEAPRVMTPQLTPLIPEQFPAQVRLRENSFAIITSIGMVSMSGASDILASSAAKRLPEAEQITRSRFSTKQSRKSSTHVLSEGTQSCRCSTCPTASRAL